MIVATSRVEAALSLLLAICRNIVSSRGGCIDNRTVLEEAGVVNVGEG